MRTCIDCNEPHEGQDARCPPCEAAEAERWREADERLARRTARPRDAEGDGDVSWDESDDDQAVIERLHADLARVTADRDRLRKALRELVRQFGSWERAHDHGAVEDARTLLALTAPEPAESDWLATMLRAWRDLPRRDRRNVLANILGEAKVIHWTRRGELRIAAALLRAAEREPDP